MRESLSNQLLAGKSEPRERQFAHCAMLEEVIVRDGIYPFEYLSSVVGSSIFRQYGLHRATGGAW